MTFLRHCTGRALWLLLGLAIAAVLLLRREDASGLEAQWAAQVKSFAAYRWTVRGLQDQVASTAHGTRRMADSLAHVQHRADSTMAAFRDAVHEVPQGMPGRELVHLAAKCEDTVREWALVASVCQQRGDSLQRLDSLHFALYRLAASRTAHADSIIASGLHAVRCRWLLFPCPTRTTALYVGALGGLVLGYAAFHR